MWTDRPRSWPFWVAQFDPLASPAFSVRERTHHSRAATCLKRRDLVTTAPALPTRVSTFLATGVRKLSVALRFLAQTGRHKPRRRLSCQRLIHNDLELWA